MLKKAGPYIPAEHRQYHLLPYSQEHGGEVFSYPGELDGVDEALAKAEGWDDTLEEPRRALIYPYGRGSYEEYYELLDEYAGKYQNSNAPLAKRLLSLESSIKEMNVKEDWSVVRYIGNQETRLFGLTHGQYYYWPCSKTHPVYEGVIDDEEFTSYLYPCDPESWEIAEDPTGMAARALAGEADTVSFWKLESGTIPEDGRLHLCASPGCRKLKILPQQQRYRRPSALARDVVPS